MDPRSGLCEGCLRTIDEIVAWGGLDDAAKRRVWALLAQRRRDRPGAQPAAAATSSGQGEDATA